MTTTIVGNLTSDPELKFMPNGDAVTSFSVAVSKRVLDKTTNKWVDGPVSFYRCSIWREYAENVAESLSKGDRVMVTGEMRQREYEDRQGEKRSVWELNADEVAVVLRYATVKVAKVQRTNTGLNAVPNAAPNVVDDPWTTPSVEAPF